MTQPVVQVSMLHAVGCPRGRHRSHHSDDSMVFKSKGEESIVRRMFDRLILLLLEILREAGPQGLPVEDVRALLEKRIDYQDAGSPDQVIEYALDNWLIDKTIDYCRDTRGVEVGELRWFLRALSEEESEELKQLPDIKKQIIRILRRQETERGLGMIRAEELLEKLRNKGFETQYVPIADIRVSDVFKAEEGKLVKWIRLIPEFELTEDFKQTMKELEDMSLRKDIRRERTY